MPLLHHSITTVLPMTLAFAIVAALTLAGAVAAMALRNLVRCALCLTATFVGIAALYLQLGVEFVGFAQILVYVGAVAILIVFAILLTRSGESTPPAPVVSSAWWVGLGVAAATFACLAAALNSSPSIPQYSTLPPKVSVRIIGEQLLSRPGSKPDSYVLPLLVTGVLLTVALIGAVLIAAPEKKGQMSARPKLETRNPKLKTRNSKPETALRLST